MISLFVWRFLWRVEAALSVPSLNRWPPRGAGHKLAAGDGHPKILGSCSRGAVESLETQALLNVAPVAADDVGSGDSVLANDFDADGDPSSAVLAVPPSHVPLERNRDGTFRCVPFPNFFGADQFAYSNVRKPGAFDLTPK